MNNPNQTVNDSQSGTNKLNATWTAASHRSDYEQSRYYRSASGYPSGPEYVSSSRKHEKQLSSSRDHRMRTEATDSQPYPPQTRHRDLAYSDPAHVRSTQAPLTSSKKYDSSVYRPTIPPEDTTQSQAPKYEVWIPPSQNSPSSQQDRHNKEREKREREKERQRVKDEHRREHREPTDARERHKRKQEEGESDWDKDRERRERERHRETDNEKVRAQDRQRPREEYAEKRREKAEKDNAERTEREQRKYMEMVQRKAEETEIVREREREKRRQEKERERERERHKQRKDEERADERISKTDVERDKEKERKRERREREHRREVESGRESERDPDRRRRKGDLEQGKERPKRLIEVPVASYDGTRREVELEESRRMHMQDVARRHKAGVIDGGPGSRDQEAERNRHATKDLSGARRKDHEKVQNLGDESEADRVRHSDKENVVRREHKTHEKAKRNGASRSNAERGTDSEREPPSYRDVAFSNTYLREAVLPGAVGPETAGSFSKSSAAHRLRDDKGPLVTQTKRMSFAHPSTGTNLATPIPPISQTLNQIPPNDGYATHSNPIPIPRPIDTSSTTAKYSPVSIVSANGESPRLDSTGSDVVKTKQPSSSHRTLKRQSRIANLVPEQITIYPTKHSQPQDVLQPPVDVAPSLPSHAPRPRKDSGRLHPAEAPEYLSFQTNQALPPKADFRSAPSMAPLPSGRAPTRDSTIIPQPHGLHDKRSPEVLQVPQKDLQVGVPTPEAFPSVGMPGIPANNPLSNSFLGRVNQDPRTAVKGPDISIPMPVQPLLAPSVEKIASSSSTKPSASMKSTIHPVVNDIPLRRPYSTLGESSLQERGERAKEKVAPISPTGLSSSPGAPQAYPVDRSISSDVQHSNGITELQPATPFRRLAPGIFESKQEDLQSRVQPLVPIPENATLMASHRPASRPQIDPLSQPAITDKRAPSEPTSATRVEQEGLQSRVNSLAPIPENVTVTASHRPASRLQIDPPSQPAITDKRAPSEPTLATRIEQESLQSRVHPLAPIPENATVAASPRPASRLQIDLPSQPAVTDKRAPSEPISATRVEQESLQSRVHPLAPIPENTTVAASHHPASRLQIDPLSQPAVTDKRAPSEPTSARVEQESLQSRVHPLAPIPENTTVAASHRPASRLQIDPLSQPAVTDKRAPSELTSARVEQESLQSRVHPLAPIPENVIVAASHRPASRLQIDPLSQPAVTDKRAPSELTSARVEQESLQSRVHPLAPIPENATVATSHRPASRIQIDPLSQPAVTDKRGPSEPTSATRVALRSMSEPIGGPSRLQTDLPSQQPVAAADKRAPLEPTSSARVTFRSVSESSGAHYIPVVKMKPIKSGRDEGKRVVTDPYHTSYSVNPETALRSLTGQHKHDDVVVYPMDPGREGAHVKYSPNASSRREVSAQLSTNKGPNVNDTLRSGHVKAYSSNHGRTESSPGKTAEGPLPAISYSPSSRPTEEKHGHVSQASLERHVNELDMGVSKDFNTTRDRGDRLQFTEREPTAVVSTGVALSSTTPVVVPQMVTHDGRPDIAHGLVAGNSHDSKKSDYHQNFQRPQHQVPDTAPREQDVIRKQRREGTKKTRSPNKDQVQLIYKEEHDYHRPPPDNRNTSHHEGSAHPGKKTGTGTSPVAAVSRNSFPQPEPFSEVDSRHGTPREVLQSSPGQHPASSIVKTPNQGVNKPESSQEYSPKASVSRPHESPSRYPHSVYRSSPSYPAANATQQSTMDYSKNQPSSHIPSNHSQSHSPSFLPSRDARETTPVVTHNEQLLPDFTESGNKTSSKYHRGQPKEQASASPRSTRPDNSRMGPSKPINPLANPQLPEPVNYPTSSHVVQPDMNRRVAETNPAPLPPSSILFSKGIDQSPPYTPPEYKGAGDSRTMLNNHLPRPTEYSHGSSHDQDFEKHEPRLITPKSQKLPEFSELQHRSTHYDGAKVSTLEPHQETHKKSASLDTSRMKPSSNYPPEIWHPPVPAREYEPDRTSRRHVVSVAGPSIPAVIRAQPSTSIGMMLPLDEEVEQANLAQNPAPVPDIKVYRYLRGEKRNRTISVLSMEAQDGTTSILGSPTASILSQPPIRVPSRRDPMKAAHEWMSENIEEASKRGKTAGKRRIMRPGVVFDVVEDPPLAERPRHRSKASRSKTQPTRT